MESDSFPPGPRPARRKPRSPASKISPPEERFAPAPIPEEIGKFAQAEEIFEFPENPARSREPGFLARLDFAMPILAVAFVLFLFSQVLALGQNASMLTWRSINLDRQAEALKVVRANAAATLRQRQNLVEEAQRLSNSYNTLLVELLQLAQTDKDARSVVEKFGIKNNAHAQSASSAQK